MHTIAMLPSSQSFTKQYFIEGVLTPLYNRICEQRPATQTRGIFLHFDNARPHLVDQKLAEFGFTRLPHTPYSQDLAQSDFFLFGYLKFLLEGMEFESPDALFQEVTKILNSIPKQMLHSAYLEWIKRLQKCIEHHGEYVH